MKRAGTPAAGAVLALVAAIAFWPVVSGERSFFHWDLRYEIVPLWHVSQQSVHSGRMPFWIEGQYCGHPALLRQEVSLFYPLTLPLLATNGQPHRLADLFSLFHFWLAGFAAYLLLRDLRADFVSGLFAGVAWMLSARLLQSAIWPNAVAVSALLPFVVLGLVRIGRGRRRSGVLVTSAAGALCLLAFRPQVLVGAVPILIALVVSVAIVARERRTAFIDLLVAGLLALALAAPALLTSGAIYPLSTRAGGLSRAERDLYPIGFGQELDQVFLPVDGPTRWPEPAAYAGVVTGLLFVAGAAVLLLRRSTVPRPVFAALLVGGLVGLAFSFGEAGPYGLVADLPVFRSFRVPARYLVSWSLALALGSGLALSDFLGRVRNRQLVGFGALALLCLDLVWHARRCGPTISSEFYTIEPAIVRTLRKLISVDEAGFRKRYWTPARPVNVFGEPEADQLGAARWLEPLSFGLGMQFGFEALQGQQGPTLRTSQVLSETPSWRAATLAGVGCVIRWMPREPGSMAPPRIHIQSVTSLPRALILPEAIRVPSSRAMATALDSALDPSRTAVVEDAEPLARQPGWDAASGSVRLRHREPGRVELSASPSAEGVLVLAESYEKGWHATLDGRSARVFRANGAFLGLRVPPGRHAIRFDYRPRGLRAGLALAAAGAIGLVLAAVRLPGGQARSEEAPS